MSSVHCPPRIQVDPAKYRNMFQALRLTTTEEGMRALGKGWAPTLIGYSMQGLCKFGFYEVFKVFYSNLMGEVRSQCVPDLLPVIPPHSPSLLLSAAGEHLPVPHLPLPGSQCQRRVLCRHSPRAHGGGEGPSPDWSGLGQHSEGVCPQAVPGGGHHGVSVTAAGCSE